MGLGYQVNNVTCFGFVHIFDQLYYDINPLQTKRRPLYLNTQSVPRSKHFSSRL